MMAGQNGRVPYGYIPTNDKLPHAFAIKLQSQARKKSKRFEFFFECARDNIFRTTFSSTTHPLPPQPSVKPLEPIYETSAAPEYTGTSVMFKTATMKVCVEWRHTPVVSIYIGKSAFPIHCDIPDVSYAVCGLGTSHHYSYYHGALHVGLGDESSSVDLSGQRFVVGAGDDGGGGPDALRKRIPLVISLSPRGCVGVFSTSYGQTTWSIGCEKQASGGSCSAVHQTYGGLEEYIIVGRTVEEVVSSYAQVVGFPPLIPRYMLGHIAGDINATTSDRPPAWSRIMQFIVRCGNEDIPISAFHLGHAYAAPENPCGRVQPFPWNKVRFPDPKRFIEACHNRNVRILVATTPLVLLSNRVYAYLAERGALFATKTGGGTPPAFPRWYYLTGSPSAASLLDFTSATATEFWSWCIRDLRDMGIDGIFNDYNDFRIVGDDWSFRLDSYALEAPRAPVTQRRNVRLWGRALHTNLLNQATHQALVAARPMERPLVLTQSAAPGTMFHATISWSGDNLTSWYGVHESNALTLRGENLSLINSHARGIGEPQGTRHDREVFVRWVQLAVYSPRFVINCNSTSRTDYRTGGYGVYPWTWPELLPLVRNAIRRRYELIPYLYSLALESHLTARPPQRWTGWGYENDPEVWKRRIKVGTNQYWLGNSLLVCGAYEHLVLAKRRESLSVYLPVRLPEQPPGGMYDRGFLNTNAPYQRLEAGRWHEVEAQRHTSIAVLARIGSAVPVGRGYATTCVSGDDPEFRNAEKDDWRGVEIFPMPLAEQMQDEPADFRAKDCWLEDDGISPPSKAEGSMAKVEVDYRVMAARPHSIEVGVTLEADAWVPLWVKHGIEVILPPGQERLMVNLPEWSGRSHPAPRLLRRDEKGRARWLVRVRASSPS
ncbi:Alpha-glucosidase 2 [Tolypocladium capitatum]|uniref:alpha-glucosidase n=1 Tax=Tolypocladium capitatum TaxID=45235 RepID=A0A2K3QE63_9HYPO|nr:Alpha-glucosidase 2 [Tolypocladium capitatum]